MSAPIPLVLLLVLLAACSRSPEERAKADALHMLRRDLGPAAQLAPASLKVYNFTKAQVSFYTSDVATFGDGHLVTYEATLPKAAGPQPVKAAVYVADNDSAFYFLPARHQAQFQRDYDVQLPAPAAP